MSAVAHSPLSGSHDKAGIYQALSFSYAVYDVCGEKQKCMLEDGGEEIHKQAGWLRMLRNHIVYALKCSVTVVMKPLGASDSRSLNSASR